MRRSDVEGAVALQRACFPPPFPEALLWTSGQLLAHLEVFPEGQFVAVEEEAVVGSCSNLVISEDAWQAHDDWQTTVGGPLFSSHDPQGTTLYGADISVHPSHRGHGIGRGLYGARFDLVRRLGLVRFGTACRIPDWLEWMVAHRNSDKDVYCREVVAGRARDRTLGPLLRFGLRFVCVVEGHMEDEESGDAAAVLEWTP